MLCYVAGSDAAVPHPSSRIDTIRHMGPSVGAGRLHDLRSVDGVLEQVELWKGSASKL
jgi:hypothetical protein